MSRKLLSTICLAACAIAMGQAHAAGILEVQGQGVQVYRCAAVGKGFGWSLIRPDATLVTSAGTAAGRHFEGPSWQATDGSVVVGEVVASGAAPSRDGQAAAIPWLVLRAKSRTGAGIFEAVTYVTRTRTVGGTAPTTACDAGRAGREERVDYTATYTFFGVK